MTKGKVLVTGANGGLGLAITLEVARRGYTAIGSVRSDEKAEFLHKEAGEAGVVVGHLLLDVTDAERCARVIEDVGPSTPWSTTPAADGWAPSRTWRTTRLARSSRRCSWHRYVWLVWLCPPCGKPGRVGSSTSPVSTGGRRPR